MTALAAAPALDAQEFRRAMGRFLSGVTVISATRPGHEPRGMTASAFMSVSLEPALVAVSVDQGAQMHDHILAAGRFAASFLAAGQSDHAFRFAGRPRKDGLPARFTQLGGVAVLDDALAAVACRLQATHPAGDHTLFVGEVLALRVHPHHDRPLAYYAGAFHRIAPHPSIPAPPVSPWGSGFEECWG